MVGVFLTRMSWKHYSIFTYEFLIFGIRQFEQKKRNSWLK